MIPTRITLDPDLYEHASEVARRQGRRDEYHEQARAMFAGPPPRWHTSVLVWSEAYNWFLHQHGDEAARSFGSMVASLEGLVMFTADVDHHSEVCRMSDRLRGEHLTYVDASSLVLMDRHGIAAVWSTDTRLGLTGVTVVPNR